MSIKYTNYYENYSSVHESVKKAVELSSNTLITKNMCQNINDLLEVVSKAKVNNQSDIVISMYNGIIDKKIEDMNKVLEYSNSYTNVENAYTELNEELNTLKEQDELFREIYKSKPTTNDEKYKIPVKDGIGYNKEKYDFDFHRWESSIRQFDKNCNILVENIRKYINYLNSVDEFDSLKGRISNPNLSVSTEYINKSMSTIPDGILLPTPYVLTGEELERFLEENNISNEPYVKVYKKYVLINGIMVKTYMVYDNDCSKRDNVAFSNYVEESLNYESKIDPAILNCIFTGNSASSIIFVQTYRCDKTYEKNDAAAYYRPSTRNITMYPANHAASIVHETGHAYDYYLGYRATNQWTFLSTLNSNYNGAIYDKNGNVITWGSIVLTEAAYFDETHNLISPGQTFNTVDEAKTYYKNYCINASDYVVGYENGAYVLRVSYDNNGSGGTFEGKNSAYNVYDYVQMPYEYFADAFRAYWLGDDIDKENGTTKLGYLCPTTNSALISLFNIDRENYYGGNTNE